MSSPPRPGPKSADPAWHQSNALEERLSHHLKTLAAGFEPSHGDLIAVTRRAHRRQRARDGLGLMVSVVAVSALVLGRWRVVSRLR